MKRGKKIIVVAHCYLNQNARVKPYASRKGSFKEIIKPLIDADFGIIQLPCPETTACGLSRWEAVTEQYDSQGFRRHCRNILQPYVDQFVEHQKVGDKIYAILGIPFSPCCGCENNPSHKKWGGPVMNTQIPNLELVTGPAVFMQELMKLTKEVGLDVKFMDVCEDPNIFPANQPEKILEKLLAKL
jgi:predicted secreted protein